MLFLFLLYLVIMMDSGGRKWDCKPNVHWCADWHFPSVFISIFDNLVCISDSYFSNGIKYVLNLSAWLKKNNPQSSQFYKFQPCTGCYPLLDVRSPLNREQMMEKSDEDWDFKFHFLFLLFRAFHSPSWVAKLPKSSFTFLFLSESLKHGARKKKKLEAFF